MRTPTLPRSDRVRRVRVSTEAERQRLLDDFVRLCEIESPSKRERAVAEAVRSELGALGLEVEEDDTGAETGSEAGNLLARIPGPEDARTILLCAHLDTVPLAGPVEVTRENGVLSNRHDAILGADNKAAVATVLGSARRLATEGSPVGVELLFTTCEEVALAGAKAFDRGRLRVGVRLRFRPRVADRGDRPRLAHLLPHRDGLPRPRGARGHSPGGGS